jgi:hypothetical protein
MQTAPSCILLDSNEDVEEDLNLWELSDEKRVDFISALQCRIIREFTRAVSLYEDVSDLFL